MGKIGIMHFLKCHSKIPTKFLKLLNKPLTIILSSIQNNLTKTDFERLKQKEMRQPQLLLHVTVNRKGISHLDKIWALQQINRFVEMPFVHNVEMMLAVV